LSDSNGYYLVMADMDGAKTKAVTELPNPAKRSLDDNEVVARLATPENGINRKREGSETPYLLKVDALSKTCEVVSTPSIGYYKNEDPEYGLNSVIKCNEQDSVIICSLIISTESECTNKAGKMVSSGFNVGLCLDGTNIQRFSSDISNAYIKGADGSIFGVTADNYYELNVTDKSILLNKNEKQAPTYYSPPGESITIYECVDQECLQLKSSYHFENDANGKSTLYNCGSDGSCTAVVLANIGKGYYNAGVKSTNPEGYERLITCTTTKTNDAVTSASCSYELSPKVGYYLEATQKEDDTTKSTLLNCTEDSGKVVCKIDSTNVKTDSGYAYLDASSAVTARSSTTYSRVIVCTTDNQCDIEEKPTGTAINYYIDASDADDKTIIKCTSTGCTSSNTVPALVNNAVLLVGGEVGKTTILKCDEECSKWKAHTSRTAAADEEEGTEAVNEFYLDAGSSTNLIMCVVGACSQVPKGNYSSKPLYFIDSLTAGNIITCNNSGCTSAANGASGDDGPENTYYIDGYTEGNIISCNDSSCSSSIGDTAISGVAYIDGVKNKGRYSNVIICKSDTRKCESEVGRTDNGYVYIDGKVEADEPAAGQPQQRKRGVVDDDEQPVYKNIIICKQSDGCTSVVGDSTKSGLAYINARDNKEVIYCDETEGCKATSDNVNIPGHVFINGKDSTEGEDENLIYKNIINCDEGVGCSSVVGLTEGKAYIEGRTMNEDEEFYVNIIKCTSDEGCTSGAGVTTDGIGYVDGSDTANDKVITCSEEAGCTSGPASRISGQVYIDGTSAETVEPGGRKRTVNTVYSKIINCFSGRCKIEDGGYGTDGKAYIDAKAKVSDEAGAARKKRDPTYTYPNIIICEEEAGCSSSTIEEVVAGAVYIDGTNAKNIIICEGDEVVNCSSKLSDATSTLNKYYIDIINSGSIITCNGSTCQTNPNGASDDDEDLPDNTFFIDGTNIANIITCSENACESAEAIADEGVGYIDGSDKTHKKVITCTTSSDEDGESEVVQCRSNSGSILTGHAYIDGFVPEAAGEARKRETEETLTNVIICTSTGCKSEAGNVADGMAYVDAKGESNGKYERVIVCTEDDGCTSKTGELLDGIVYIDGRESTGEEDEKIYPNIIDCDEGKGCVSVEGMVTGVAFIDGRSDANGNGFESIIICDTTNGCTSAEGDTDNAGVAYIDGSDETGKTVILCSTEGGCTASPGNTEEGYAYINGKIDEVEEEDETPQPLERRHLNKREAKYTNIIRCKKNDKCISEVGSIVDGEVYLDASDSTEVNIITCTEDAGCTSNEGKGEKDTYVNAVLKNNVVNCQDTCHLIPSAAQSGRSEYYVTSIEGSTSLINCVNESGTIQCSQIETVSAVVARAEGDGNEDDEEVEEEEEEAHSFAHNIFMNALNGKSDQEDTNPLIICDEDSKCTSTAVEVTDGEKKYYVNSDLNNTVPIKGDIIICSSTDDGVTCAIDTSVAKEGSVFINANFEASGKQIIQCSATGCVEVQTNTNPDSEDPEYYVNSGKTTTSSKLADALIQCTDANEKCVVMEDIADGSIFVNNANHSQTIQCSAANGCVNVKSNAIEGKGEIYLNTHDVTENDDPLVGDLIQCTFDTASGSVVCAKKNGVSDSVYINGYDKTKLIKCTESGCEVKESDATETTPAYYLNGDPDDVKNGSADIIRCKMNDKKETTCELINSQDGDVYINGNTADSQSRRLIKCSAEDGCALSANGEATEANPDIFINSGNNSNNKLINGIIACVGSGTNYLCSAQNATVNDVYINGKTDQVDLQLIKCNKNNCKSVSSNASVGNNEYYINAADKNNSDLANDIIMCTKEDEEAEVKCGVVPTASIGVYLNSNFAESGDTNQLIQCTSEEGCKGVKSKSTSKDMEYHLNAESDSLTNAIIFCANKKCEKITPTVPSYYVATGAGDNVDGLIECLGTKCSQKTGLTSNGYYLNSGYNKAINQTITCDSNEGCQTVKVDLGYYVNAGDSENPVIKCEKEGVECTATAMACPGEKANEVEAGTTCYEDSQLKFYINNNTTVAATKSDDYYSYASIHSGGFPGIKSDTNTLFKISRFFVNRFYKSGVVMIDKNGKLVDSLSSGDQSDTTLYDCNDSTKTCTQRPGCTSDTYMYDSENKKAVFCNNSKLEYADFQGYVVDGNRAVGTNHPYIIKCESNGKCKSVKPKVNSYFENSGYDSTTNALIQCSNNNCVTVAAEVGCYVGHSGEGIIQCTSTTSCTFNAVKNKSKYVNAGSNKTSLAIIECSKNGGCSAVKAKIGYYMTNSSSMLIQCTSPSNCVEYTPTVNYYDNADSSEGSNTIINCAQTSQVITCALEQTNNGFYMSSVPNVLIRCKSGSKCKTVTVKNGIFRGALKGLTGGSKRSNEDDVVDDVELEDGDGLTVAMPRDADDAYGIIRCVAGKCTALSPSEVASIPVCEFNNNKCYITLEYAMTKTATTSISAGNICTNVDRSIFYFATDTIVVKPNVISGVTATYVYTTTNSNCLEVNDSYTDMYFTVGSNIYLLDQGSVLQFYETGYYFINTAKNIVVSGNDIDAYNDENVKLYKCNGSSCSITDKPDSLTYYADVNKRILKYNVNSDSYSFAYPKDIICIFANNKCTPNADLKNQEFCITYKGELVLAKQDIKNRETGECYKASTITTSIYGYSQYLYNMNVYSAQMVDETGYYIVNLSTNTTISSKNYKTKNNNFVIYGCQLSTCKEYVPDEDTYYYDARAKTIIRYRDGNWSAPSTSGYAYISLDPANTHIYRFTKQLDEIRINAMASYGYYYTIDGEMYHCDQDEDGDCTQIDNTGYYFTNAGEVYYCVHDSEQLEPTECTRQTCISGQYYYIDEAYYRCEISSLLVPVVSRYCSYNDNVIINFPLALTEELPDKIKQAVEGIEKNNNSTAIINRRSKNYLESISGVFTNCTYNVEETKSTFDLVCVNNYVSVNQDTDEVKICSVEQLGYVECVEDEENPEKCNVSRAFNLRPSFITIILISIASFILYRFN